MDGWLQVVTYAPPTPPQGFHRYEFFMLPAGTTLPLSLWGLSSDSRKTRADIITDIHQKGGGVPFAAFGCTKSTAANAQCVKSDQFPAGCQYTTTA